MLCLLRLQFSSRDAAGVPVLVLCVILQLGVVVFTLLVRGVLVLVDRLCVIELMPHV